MYVLIFVNHYYKKKLFRYHKQEQLNISIRYVVDRNIVEIFIEFVIMSSGQDANYVVAAICNCFEKLHINIIILNVVAQSHDEASVMSDFFGGVKAK